MSTVQPPLPVAGEEPWDATLNDYISTLDIRAADLETENANLTGRVAALETLTQSQAVTIESLDARITALETAPGAAKTILHYTMVSQTAPPPSSSGQMRTDNAAPSQSTHLYVSNVTEDNTNVNHLLTATPIGAILYLQDRMDDTKWARFTVTANNAPSGYEDFTVTPLSNSGIEISKSTQKVVLVLPQ